MLAYEILLDIGLGVLVIWFVISQLVLPLLKGSRLFPTFSKPAFSIKDEIAQVEQEIAAEHLRHELKHKRDELAHEQKGQE
jgi:hypothetical protein